MASLRVRRVPALASRLALSSRSTPATFRAFSIIRSPTKPSKPSINFYSPRHSTVPQLRLFSTTVARHEETVVKVPQMAESISEGTLSSFSKQVGDHVELDEEIASIETDKIDVSVNAPAAGVITELLVGEGDTVTVGQDLAKIDVGASGGGEQKGDSETKAPEPEEQKTQEAPKSEEKPAPAPKKEEKKPEPKKESKSEPKPEKKDSEPSTGAAQSPFGKGSRGEHRVRTQACCLVNLLILRR